jgi:hypothetical protein
MLRRLMTASIATTGSWLHRSTLGLVGAALIAAWTIAALRIVMAPAASLLTDVAIDDALYYTLPARHWWQGLGFSFDGLEPTNGVQTLWALVTLGLAGVVDDPTTMLRCQVAISGLAWAAAAVLLFAWLRPRNHAAALLASHGFRAAVRAPGLHAERSVDRELSRHAAALRMARRRGGCRDRRDASDRARRRCQTGGPTRKRRS